MIFLLIAFGFLHQALPECPRHGCQHHIDSWSFLEPVIPVQMECLFLGISINDFGQLLWVLCLPLNPSLCPEPYGTLTNSVSSSPGGQPLLGRGRLGKTAIAAGDEAELVESWPSMHKGLLNSPQHHTNQMWWHMPVSPALKRWRQKDSKVILSYKNLSLMKALFDKEREENGHL